MESAALEHRAGAAGRRWLEEGFAFEPEHDLWFALGWPHLVLMEGEPEDPVAVAREQIATGYQWNMARSVAVRLCRVWARSGYGYQRQERRFGFSAEGEAALASDEPLSEEEATAIVRELAEREQTKPRALELLLTTEALVGTELVTKTLIEVASGWEDRGWDEPNRYRFEVMRALGVLLLRLPKKVEAASRKALEKMAPKEELTTEPGRQPSGRHGLLLALEGAAGARRLQEAGGALRVGDLSFAVGDREWVYGQLAAYDEPRGIDPDARRIFVGGEEVLGLELGWWRSYKPEAQAVVVETYGLVRSPTTVILMLDMAERSRVKRQVTAWFREHWDYAEPQVKKAKSGKTHGAIAKKLLERLG